MRKSGNRLIGPRQKAGILAFLLAFAWLLPAQPAHAHLKATPEAKTEAVVEHTELAQFRPGKRRPKNRPKRPRRPRPPSEPSFVQAPLPLVAIQQQFQATFGGHMLDATHDPVSRTYRIKWLTRENRLLNCIVDDRSGARSCS